MTPLSKHTYHAIGLMSGSSLDGLDIAYCRFERETSGSWDFQLIHQATADLGEWKDILKKAVNLSRAELDQMSIYFAEYMAKEVLRFKEQFKINTLDLIASHGHTIYHYPEKGKTCQIGDGQVLANKTGDQVVCNLRQRDMDFGGQGAPIVPIGDKYLFSHYSHCLNIGGIANISVKNEDKILAYDIGPANQVLNGLALRMGKAYDMDGLLARDGQINEALFHALNGLDYYKIVPPKSLDNAYSREVIQVIDDFGLSTKDSLATFTEHLAFQIALNINKSETSHHNRSVLVTGGGAHNKFLVERIKEMSKCDVLVPSNDIIDYKEAVVMGLIGVLRTRNEINVLASVTGGSQDTSSGEVFLPE